MAQLVIQLDREKLSCSICLDLLKDPVTIACGHSYCMRCIKDCWDEENERKKTHSCPQCRQSFTPRPVLMKNTMLGELVEELRKVGLQAASLDHSYAGPGDVACDYCTGMKLKAFKSFPLKKHKLVEATLKLQENICSRHDDVMKIFCRTDQQGICYLCCMDDCKVHDTERQIELRVSRQNIQQRVQGRERDIKVLQQRVEAINVTADEAVRDSEEIFTELIHLIKKRSSEVKQRIRSQQKTEVSRAKELAEKLQQELTELWRKDTELEKLSHTGDNLHFPNNYPSLSRLSESKDEPGIDIRPPCSFGDVTAAVSEARDKLQAVLSEEWAKISLAVIQAEPRTRAEFLKYSCQIALDPNTAHKCLWLCDRDRKATLMEVDQLYLDHPDRFLKWKQVLSREGLTGRCYWEVKWSGNVSIAVAYKDISSRGTENECGFGFNDKSWSFVCYRDGYTFRHDNISTSISGPQSSRIGVYLDHRAGTLSYYSISETMTLLHRVQTTFTQPLYPGFWLRVNAGNTAEFCKLEL